MSKERELLEKIFTLYKGFSNCSKMTVLLNEAKELLAQPEPEPEPVAWMWDIINCDGSYRYSSVNIVGAPYERHCENIRPLYTAPPTTTRKPLSKGEFMRFFTDTYDSNSPITDFVRAIEEAHGIIGETNDN